MRSSRRNTSLLSSNPAVGGVTATYPLRLERLRESLLKKGIDGFVVTNLINVRYLSGFRGTAGSILVTKGKSIFITDFRYREEVEREFGGPAHRRIAWEIVIEKGNRLKTIRGLARGLGIRTLGFEATLPYESFRGLSRSGARLRPLRELVEGLRAVKDDAELALIRKAVSRAETAFLEVKPLIRPGRREREIARMLEEKLKRGGCDCIPFDIIVASGENSAMPHAKVTDRKLTPGDLVVIDWGGEANGYCSDMTRTFLMGGGDPTKKREIYRAVLAANRKAVASVMPGVREREVDGIARRTIGETGYGRYFGHGTGHGVGLEVHELPRITWTGKDTIREGMVFTMEPGIYLPGLGGVRIEDMVLARRTKPEVLTRLPRALEII